ncbi:uncharacterized protein METZ01_LOCUS436448, partial [marine metagenome]
VVQPWLRAMEFFCRVGVQPCELHAATPGYGCVPRSKWRPTSMRHWKKTRLATLIAMTIAFCGATALTLNASAAKDTIKVGILHSLSGTMAISETSLKDVALMTIEEINKNGGVLGKKLEPVIVDPASNWPLFA